jgi:hypothetical protein
VRVVSAPHYEVIAHRRDLCSRPCTLDGAPAVLAGALEPFPTVCELGRNVKAQFSWPTVERIMADGGAFTA